MTFRDLAVGDTFDLILPNSGFNSFYVRCVKISTRCYMWEKRGKTHTGQVGTVRVPVYHVEQGGTDGRVQPSTR
jgi:hypothetical protein